MVYYLRGRRFSCDSRILHAEVGLNKVTFPSLRPTRWCLLIQDDGNREFKAGDYEGAVASYSKAIQLDGSMAAARNNRAMALLKLERWQEALTDCEAVLSSDAGNVKAMLRRGQALRQLGNADGARAAYEDVLKVQPKNKEAESALAALTE